MQAASVPSNVNSYGCDAVGGSIGVSALGGGAGRLTSRSSSIGRPWVTVGSDIGFSADAVASGVVKARRGGLLSWMGWSCFILRTGVSLGSQMSFPSVLRYGVVLLDPRELGEDAVVAVYDGVMLDRQRPDVGVGYRIGPVANSLE